MDEVLHQEIKDMILNRGRHTVVASVRGPRYVMYMDRRGGIRLTQTKKPAIIILQDATGGGAVP